MRVELHINAKKDLDAWFAKKPAEAADIIALIQQMRSDHELQDKLLDQNSNHEDINVRRWEEQFRKKNDLYRIKSINAYGHSSAKWRLIYAYFPPGVCGPDPEYYVMAIVDRDKFNYEADNEYTKRILHDINFIKC
ncbi:hypothetical protein [Rheinheimera fenheensis]|uniref:hypothetical protein n=1 Tax=Rheinheimera fenheensis TaxID=3152295 RepID=UPI0032604C85